MRRRDFALIAIALALAIAPMGYAALRSALAESAQRPPAFAGTDDRAKTLVGELAPAYRPWFASVWTPPSKDAERALFGLQAALGAGFIGFYVISRRRSRADRPGEESRR